VKPDDDSDGDDDTDDDDDNDTDDDKDERLPDVFFKASSDMELVITSTRPATR